MSHARSQHPNAPLTPEGRRMVCCVIDDGWTVTAAAERFQVDAKTVRKWRIGASGSVVSAASVPKPHPETATGPSDPVAADATVGC